VRQRLSSEPDRYRGRRRVPTPPRARYAAVVTTAFVGAGVVALGAAGLPDAKAVDPSTLADLQAAAASSQDVAARAADADRASRDSTREEAVSTMVDTADIWMLPLTDYTFSSPYGVQYGELHGGIDLAAPEGTPYRAIHAGTVTKAGWYGGYGYVVIVRHADGTEAIYGHSAKLLVKEGQQIKAGDEIGLVGSTGHAYGTQLHLELHVNGSPTDPIPWLRDKGVDIKLQVEAIYSDAAAS
jgi:murein DD-endopeptidase MepM/ murein hydrolase activator NlpD